MSEQTNGAPGLAEVTRTEARQETQRPKRYKVLMHNDDYTTMDFVVQVLHTVFGKSPATAVRLMLTIHYSGVAVVGVYTLQVAETKINEVHALAREHGFPLRCTTEPE